MHWSVCLDKARQWPHGQQPLVWETDAPIGQWVERPVAFRCGVYSEMFLVTAVYPSLHAEFSAVAEARYVGLRRPCPLMSLTEKRLSPTRFPQ